MCCGSIVNLISVLAIVGLSGQIPHAALSGRFFVRDALGICTHSWSLRQIHPVLNPVVFALKQQLIVAASVTAEFELLLPLWVLDLLALKLQAKGLQKISLWQLSPCQISVLIAKQCKESGQQQMEKMMKRQMAKCSNSCEVLEKNIISYWRMLSLTKSFFCSAGHHYCC